MYSIAACAQYNACQLEAETTSGGISHNVANKRQPGELQEPDPPSGAVMYIEVLLYVRCIEKVSSSRHWTCAFAVTRP